MLKKNPELLQTHTNQQPAAKLESLKTDTIKSSLKNSIAEYVYIKYLFYYLNSVLTYDISHDDHQIL